MCVEDFLLRWRGELVAAREAREARKRVYEARRNAARKRARCVERARALSDADLLAILAERLAPKARAKAKGKAKPKPSLPSALGGA